MTRASLVCSLVFAALAGCGTEATPPPLPDLSIVCSAPETLCGNACANLMTDAKSCGACGMACTADQFCDAGRCALFCSRGFTACGQSCINLTNDSANCGACAVACPPGNLCSMGKCALTCQMG